MFKSFKKYVENREEGLVGKPKEKLVADYIGPNENKPPKSPGGGSTVPYKAANGNEDPNKNKDMDGLGTLGGKELVYTPDMKPGNSKLTSLGKEIPSPWATNGTKTEQFLSKTKKMTPNKFVEFMLKDKKATEVPSLSTPYGEFKPNPNQIINYLLTIGRNDTKIIENFVYAAKRCGLLNNILEFALDHNETYEVLGELFTGNDGEARSNHLARILQRLEQVAPPQGLTHDSSQQGPNNNDQDDHHDNEDGHNDDDDDSDYDDEDNDSDDEYDDDDHDDNDSDDSDYEDDDVVANNGEDLNMPPQKPKTMQDFSNKYQNSGF